MLFWACLRLKKLYENRVSFSKKISILSFVFSLCYAVKFIKLWKPSSKLLTLCNNDETIKNFVLYFIAAVLSIASVVLIYNLLYYSLHYLLNFLNRSENINCSNQNIRLKIIKIAFLFAVSLITITICSKSSPIYPLNDWVDSNCFFTVGKSVVNGIVPYKDIYEQKGPLLYFIHSLGYLISNTSFLGIYFIEIVACFSFLVISYKIMLLFCEEKIILLIPLMSAFIYGSNQFAHGDSAEELCLPLISYCLYLGVKYVKFNTGLNFKECVLIGITSGMVLWIKYTMLGFYVGFFIVILVIMMKQHDFEKFFKAVGSIALGVCITTLPIIIYFLINNALFDLFKVYFYDNIFMYTTSEANSNIVLSSTKNIYAGVLSIGSSLVLLIALGLLFSVLFNNKKLIFLLTFTELFSIVFIYMGGRRYVYYSLILSIFIPFSIIALYFLIKSINFDIKNIKLKRLAPLFICVASFSFMFLSSNNVYLLKYSKQDLPQYKFNEIISKSDKPTLLNYGFLDGGFYTVSNIVPNCKYFCGLNIPNPEIMSVQNYYVNNGLVDYIITRNDKKYFELYQCISECEFVFEDAIQKYYLYQIK